MAICSCVILVLNLYHSINWTIKKLLLRIFLARAYNVETAGIEKNISVLKSQLTQVVTALCDVIATSLE
jgi:hypothetical protein